MSWPAAAGFRPLAAVPEAAARWLREPWFYRGAAAAEIGPIRLLFIRAFYTWVITVGVLETATWHAQRSTLRMAEWVQRTVSARVAAGEQATVIDCSAAPVLGGWGGNCGCAAWRLCGAGHSVTAVDLLGEGGRRLSHPARKVLVDPGQHGEICARLSFRSAATHRLSRSVGGGTHGYTVAPDHWVVAIGAMSSLSEADAGWLLREAVREASLAPRGRALVVEPLPAYGGFAAACLRAAILWRDGGEAVGWRRKWEQRGGLAALAADAADAGAAASPPERVAGAFHAVVLSPAPPPPSFVGRVGGCGTVPPDHDVGDAPPPRAPLPQQPSLGPRE